MNLNKTKILFFGTPDLSARILRSLVDAGFDIVGVVTETDKPVGRSQEIIPTPVKIVAEENQIPVYQPKNKEELKTTSQEIDYDLGVVVAYGVIIPKEVLEKPKYSFINFHPSLLPQLRGASPIQSAILQGLEKTGVTIMLMDEGLDTGPILSQLEIPLDGVETTTSLGEKIIEQGPPLLIKTISEFISGEIKPKNQDNNLATYCEKIKKEDGHIDFSKTAEEEYRKFRAYIEWPGSYSFWGDKRVKLTKITLFLENFSNSKLQITNYKLQKNGAVFLGQNGNLCVKFSDGYWIINQLQIEGKKAMNSEEFLNGYKDFLDSVLK